MEQIDIHFIRERVIGKNIILLVVSSNEQFVDILIKGFSAPFSFSYIITISCLAAPLLRLRGDVIVIYQTDQIVTRGTI